MSTADSLVALANFTLSDGERMSPVWMRLRDHMRGLLQQAREKNDDPNLTEAKTAALRGQIKCLQGLVALGEPPRDG